MLLTSMHPMFQVSIDFCDRSSSKFFSVESKLQSQNYESYWNLKCLLACQDWSPTMAFFFANCSHNIL